ncbi:MAG: hypothetical protein M3007_07820 [Candidatus Eremiobacteraeota bacterium]|nr:hypothetical protein [Candidatus Eremiobacteraeota bacterium]
MSKRFQRFLIAMATATVIAAATDLSACGGGATLPGPAPKPTATTILVPMGVDFGLKRQCVRTWNPTLLNFYSDDVDCPGATVPSSNFWLTAAQIENFGTFGVGCHGPPNQSVLINSAGSPVTENWQGSSATGYTVELKVDYSSVTNLCTAPTWTAVPFQDNICCGGPFPRPDQLRVQFTASFNRTAVGGGGSHASAEIIATWLVAGSSTPIIVSVVIELFFDQSYLCCGIPPGLPADVIAYATPGSSPSYPGYVVDFDGTKLNPPIQLQLSTSTPITIDWGQILAHVFAENLVPTPVNGWANSSATTTDNDIDLELKNTVTGTGGGMADLLVSNYRETAVINTAKK